MLMHFGLYSPKCKKARPYGLAVESKIRIHCNPGLTAWVAVYYTNFSFGKRKVSQKKKTAYTGP